MFLVSQEEVAIIIVCVFSYHLQLQEISRNGQAMIQRMEVRLGGWVRGATSLEDLSSLVHVHVFP